MTRIISMQDWIDKANNDKFELQSKCESLSDLEIRILLSNLIKHQASVASLVEKIVIAQKEITSTVGVIIDSQERIVSKLKSL